MDSPRPVEAVARLAVAAGRPAPSPPTESTRSRCSCILFQNLLKSIFFLKAGLHVDSALLLGFES